MRVLYVASSLPWSPDDGERVRSHHLLRELATRVDLTVAVPVPAPGSQPPAELAAAAWRFFAPDGADGRTRLGCALSLTPVFFRAARSAPLLRWLEQLPGRAFDAVHLDGLPAFHYAGASHRVSRRVVLDLRDSWSMLYARLLASDPSPARRFKRLCVERIERRVLATLDPVTVVSPVDRDYLCERYATPPSRLHVVPNGVARELFALPAFALPASPPRVVFTGAMNYGPNEEAALWFAARVLPALRERVPGLRFAVVGKLPSARLRALAGEAVEVTGAVASMGDWLARADVVVAPLRSGAGMKNKVLEALASGRPTVASPVAIEGIDVTHGRDLLVADSPAEWADAVARLLAAPDRAAALARTGRARIAGRYGWAAAASQYVALYEGRAAARASDGPW